MQLPYNVVNTEWNHSTNPNAFSQSHEYKLPQSAIPLCNVPTYNFRVVETVDENDKILSVHLESQLVLHNNLGNPITTMEWKKCDRVKMNKEGLIVE
mgnify:CR=1 FL=1